MSSGFQKIEDKNIWQGYLRKAKFQTFFHGLEWEGFLEQNFRWLKFERYVWNGQALLSFARFKDGRQERLISHPFCEYGGPLPLVDKINGKDFSRDLLDFFKIPFKISFHPEILKYFEELPVKESQRMVYFVEGLRHTSKERFWQDLRKTTKYEIKKAQESGWEIAHCKQEKELKEFWQIYLKTARRNKVPAYPFSFFQNWLNNPAVEILLAKKAGKIKAGSVFLKYSSFIHYFLNASEKQRTRGVNHLILWSEIEKNTGKNFTVFDLGGTKKDSPLSIFKQGFANAKEPIFELKNYQDQGKENFGLARKIWRLMPIFVIKTLSPRLLRYKL